MKAATFAKKIETLKPDRIVLAAKDLPEEFIDELRSSYNITPRKRHATYSSELAELVNNYDMKGFEVLGITFKAATNRKDGHLIFAHIELDELAIDERDGKVKLLSFETGAPLYECAADGEAFLDALYEMVKLIAGRITQDQFTDPCTDAGRLAELSALPQSVEFYRWVLGCEQHASSVP